MQSMPKNGTGWKLAGGMVLVLIAVIGFAWNGAVQRGTMHERRIELLEEAYKETIRLESASNTHFSQIDDRLDRIESELREVRLELARKDK